MMTKRQLQTLMGRRHRPFLSSRAISTSTVETLPGPDVMIYDRLAEAVKQKLRRLDNPDDRFLKYNNPHPTHTDHTPVLSFPLTRVTTLPNGLRVATESTPTRGTATVGVWIDAGSRYESEKTHGTAHFLERMIFKGTKRRPKCKLEEEVENIGGKLSAHTSREKISYSAKVMDKDVPQALDILADVLQNSKFRTHRINMERYTLWDEMEMPVEGQDVIFNHLHATAFQHSPLGRTIRGSAENLRTITKDDLKNYISTQYTAPRMVVAASGAVKHVEIVEQVKSMFTKLSTGSTSTFELASKESSIFTGSEVRIVDDDVPLARFAVAFCGASWTDPDSITLLVMKAMLGSYSTSPKSGNSHVAKHTGSLLVEKLAIDEIAERMMAFNINYKDTGLFGVYAVAKPDCLDDLAYSIMKEVSRICYRSSEDDVVRARNQLKYSLLLDGTSPVAEDIGHQLLVHGRRIPYAELFARIDAVDARTIKRAASRFIIDQDIAIAAVGPVQGLPDYNWFRRRTYWSRY